MRLSEAIRKGAELRPQAHGGMFKGGGSCAIGAAIEAATGKRLGSYARAQSLFPILRRRVRHPARPLVHITLEDALLDLNDFEEWSRERIADFVETLETASA